MSTFLVNIVLIFLAATTWTADASLNLEAGSDGCQVSGAGPCCERTPSAFTDDMIHATLKEHNDDRAAEGGSNIQIIKWSTLLADMAQAATDRCELSHYNYKCGNETFGQNLALFNYDIRHRLKIVLDAWYREREHYDFGSKNCTKGKVCGHYLQMVLARVSEIGCGITKCDNVELRGEDWTDSYLLFCNYNKIIRKNESPYRKGEPCTFCQVAPGKKCTKKLCERCDPAIDPDCSGNVCPVEMKDRYIKKKCKRYKKRKYCEKKKRIMRLACAKTCDLCPVDLT